MLQVGIVGLPNVGKSTLFNVLTTAGAPAENYPFCTVEPNVGTVAVPDPRLETIRGLLGSREAVPTFVRFVDIAGLVEGAAQGEGLGNRFLAQIREVDAIAHVVRCFEDPDITHVMGTVDPERDLAVVETELILADLETVESRAERVGKKARSGEDDALEEMTVLHKLLEALGQGRSLRNERFSREEEAVVRDLNLLSIKPVLIIANVSESSDGPIEIPAAPGGHHGGKGDQQAGLSLSLALEAELSLLNPEERREFISELGLPDEGGLRVIQSAFHLLGLISFFSSNEKQTTAWAIPKGTSAPGAAGVIHSDFEKGFIRAEALSFQELVNLGTMKAARDRGLVRSEGKEYVVQDGDILLFRFNV